MASLYKQSVPSMVKYLNNLSGLLTAGAKFADEKGRSHDDILNFRLIEDMRPLPYQVQSCCNTAKFFFSRVGAIEDVHFEDDETTFDQLHTRISKTIELLQNVDEGKMEGKEKEEVIMKTRMGDFRFESGQTYLSDYSIPNFHFHLGSAYCILRHLGVPIGAFDYLGRDTFVKL